MMEELLPRHLEIIYHINHLHMETVKVRETIDVTICLQLMFYVNESEKQ